MLKQKDNVQAAPETDPKAIEIAVIAAGMFTALGPFGAGVGERVQENGPSATDDKSPSNWKVAAHRESVQ